MSKKIKNNYKISITESPLDGKEIQPVHPKGDQSWVFIGRTDAKAETPILWPPHVKSQLSILSLEITDNIRHASVCPNTILDDFSYSPFNSYNKRSFAIFGKHCYSRKK